MTGFPANLRLAPSGSFASTVLLSTASTILCENAALARTSLLVQVSVHFTVLYSIIEAQTWLDWTETRHGLIPWACSVTSVPGSTYKYRPNVLDSAICLSPRRLLHQRFRGVCHTRRSTAHSKNPYSLVIHPSGAPLSRKVCVERVYTVFKNFL